MQLLAIIVIGLLCLTGWGWWDMRNVDLTPRKPE